MSRPRRALLRVLLLSATLFIATTSVAHAQGRVVLAVYPAVTSNSYALAEKAKKAGSYEVHDRFLRGLDARPPFSLGFMQSIQGDYNRQQVMLDISQGSRQSNALYDPRDPIPLTVVPDGTGATIDGWADAAKRADKVSVTIRPGLLTQSIPGGAGFVGIEGGSLDPAIVAADEKGHVSAFSVGPGSTLLQRTQDMLAKKRFVVVTLPSNLTALGTLDKLAAARAPGDLLLTAYVPPTVGKTDLVRPSVRLLKLLAFGYDNGGKSQGVSSPTTRQPGLIVTIDLLPTILDHLGIKTPDKSRGTVMKLGKRRDAPKLEELRRRWTDVRAGRQASSIRQIIALGMLIALILGVVKGMGAMWTPVLRIGALAFMWWPSVVLGVAPLHPAKRLTETALIAAISMLLGFLTDRFVKWPRAAIVPAVFGLVFLTIDLATGSRLLTTSVLSPSITFGARFYGISNELEPLIPILALTGLAAFFAKKPDNPRLPLIYAATGLLLLVIVGWGRIGADVGGVFTVGGSFAIATLIVMPGKLTKRRIALGVLSLPAALIILIALDLGLSGGDHLSRNLGRLTGISDLWELVARRYELSFKIFKTGRPAAYFLGAALAVAFAWRNRASLYVAVEGQRVWTAALLGGLGAGIVGALTNDSGPILFTNAVIAVAALTAYLVGSPEREAALAAKPPEDADAPPDAEPSEDADAPAATPALAS